MDCVFLLLEINNPYKCLGPLQNEGLTRSKLFKEPAIFKIR